MKSYIISRMTNLQVFMIHFHRSIKLQCIFSCFYAPKIVVFCAESMTLQHSHIEAWSQTTPEEKWKVLELILFYNLHHCVQFSQMNVARGELTKLKQKDDPVHKT